MLQVFQSLEIKPILINLWKMGYPREYNIA